MQSKGIIDEMMEFNKKFVEDQQYTEYETSKFPEKKLLIFSCMDTRLIELLPRALNIKNGDAKIIKNAGAVLTHPFGSMMRSIVVAIYELKVDEILVVGHDKCGMSNTDSQGIIEKMKNCGIKEETISTINGTGIDLDKWLHGFNDVEESVLDSMNMIRNHPLVHHKIKIHGLVMNPDTGEVRRVD